MVASIIVDGVDPFADATLRSVCHVGYTKPPTVSLDHPRSISYADAIFGG